MTTVATASRPKSWRRKSALALACCLASWQGMMVPPAAAAAAEPGAELQADAAPSTAEHISLNVDDADLRAVLKLIAAGMGENFVVPPEISGRVSLHFTNVPVQDALNAICRSTGYKAVRVANIIHILPAATVMAPNDANETMPTEIRIQPLSNLAPKTAIATLEPFLSAKGRIFANEDAHALILEDTPANLDNLQQLIKDLDQPGKQLSITIDYVDPEEVKLSIEPLLSSTGKIVLNTKGRTLVVQDTVDKLAQIQQLVDGLDQPLRQVLISAKLIQLTYDNTTSVGVGISQIPSSGSAMTRLLTQGFSPNLVPPTAAGLFWGTLIDGKTQLFLDALADKNNTRLLAAPELLALDGQQARMQVGRNLGYKVITETEGGNLKESIEFLDVGTTLTVLPRIRRDNSVQLTIKPKVSSGVVTEGGIPTEDTTEVETVMQVHDGETVVIGGLLDRTRQKIRKQVPLLGDIPILGLLFGRTSWKDRESELVILITPTVIKPGRATGSAVAAQKYPKVHNQLDGREP